MANDIAGPYQQQALVAARAAQMVPMRRAHVPRVSVRAAAGAGAGAGAGATDVDILVSSAGVGGVPCLARFHGRHQPARGDGGDGGGAAATGAAARGLDLFAPIVSDVSDAGGGAETKSRKCERHATQQRVSRVLPVAEGEEGS